MLSSKGADQVAAACGPGTGVQCAWGVSSTPPASTFVCEEPGAVDTSVDTTGEDSCPRRF